LGKGVIKAHYKKGIKKMNKIIPQNQIRKGDLDTWMETSFQEYASEEVKEKRLRWMINFNGVHKITFGDEILYQGNIFHYAKNAYMGV
jgi:hypothetical protein